MSSEFSSEDEGAGGGVVGFTDDNQSWLTPAANGKKDLFENDDDDDSDMVSANAKLQITPNLS